MKQYKIIPSFEQCLKICENNKNFSHSIQTINEKEVHSFKYNLSIPEMWEENDALDGRLNMRGITFIDGQIVALPFPKFFNLGETKYTKDLDMTKIKFANEKIDGSLISIFELSGKLYCKSMKSIESDVSKEAQLFFDSNDTIQYHAKTIIDLGLSPMYEYVSPTCKIVIDYKEPKMFFLGCRNLTSGQIYYPTQDVDSIFVNIPKQFDTLDAIQEHLKASNVEGVVITLENGQMVKLKTEEYCKLHKIISNFTEKTIIQAICEEKFDDLLAQLKQNNMHDFIKQATEINNKILHKYLEIETKALHIYEKLKNLDRKNMSLKMNEMNIENHIKAIVFKIIDRKETKQLIFKYIKNFSN